VGSCGVGGTTSLQTCGSRLGSAARAPRCPSARKAIKHKYVRPSKCMRVPVSTCGGPGTYPPIDSSWIASALVPRPERVVTDQRGAVRRFRRVRSCLGIFMAVALNPHVGSPGSCLLEFGDGIYAGVLNGGALTARTAERAVCHPPVTGLI